jgi:hypothetical protein
MALIGRLTTEQIQQKTALDMKNKTNLLYISLRQSYVQIFNNFWNHPDLTPQQVSDALGTDAVYLFQLGGQLVDLLNTVKADTITQGPPLPYTINQDGTVTISESSSSSSI